MDGLRLTVNRTSRTLLKLYSMVTSLQADHLLSAAIGTTGIEPVPTRTDLGFLPFQLRSEIEMARLERVRTGLPPRRSAS